MGESERRRHKNLNEVEDAVGQIGGVCDIQYAADCAHCFACIVAAYRGHPSDGHINIHREDKLKIKILNVVAVHSLFSHSIEDIRAMGASALIARIN